MDEIDKANNRVQEMLEESLAKRKPFGPKAFGFCYFCNEPVADGRRWCGAECRDDWQKLEKSPKLDYE